MAKRITSSSVNWSLVGARLNTGDFLAFKGRTDKFLRMVLSQPPEPPKIDWNYYKSRISTPGVVDAFQKSYDSMKVPYPSDQGWLAKVDSDEAKCLKEAAEMEEEMAKKIVEYTETLKELEKHIPYSQMSVEEFMIARPEFQFDPDKPKLWPQFVDTHLSDKVDFSKLDDHH